MKTRFQTQAILFLLSVVAAGCGTHEKPNTIYMPDMVYSQSFKAQEEGSNRMPVKGTIPRGFQPYTFGYDAELAGKTLKNPLARTESVLARGKVVFDTYCMPCHGPSGEGDGSIIPKFPRPPTLHSDKVNGWTDGRIYHVIAAGQGLMPNYASQVAVEDRWAIIHYIRALQRAKNPSAGGGQ